VFAHDVNMTLATYVSKLQAPFTPFLMELMYQNLRHLLVADQTSDNTSIYYLMMPRAK